MWRYDDLLIVTEVIKHGSFIKASKKLNIPSSTISRRVSEFELALGVRLLERNSRKLSLTEKGQYLFNHCHPQIQSIKDVIQTIQLDNDKTVGKLRVTAPITLGNELLNGWFCDFAKIHPEIKLEIVLSNDYEDLLDDSFDIAIRVGPLKDSEFIAQFLLSSDSILCASEKYLKHVKTDLTTLYQIEQCDFLSYQSDKSSLRLLNSSNKEALELKVNNRMSSSSTTVLRQAAVDGLGLACLPMISVKKEILSSELIHLFKGTVGVKRNEIYMVYPSKVHLSKKMKLFMEHLKQKAMKIS
jgi:DNA-binding transcriptional LysR family regulator